MCYDTDCYEDCWCSLRTKTIFHAIFSIVNGLLIAGIGICVWASGFIYPVRTEYFKYYIMTLTITAIAHTFGGIFMIVGVFKSFGNIFQLGLFMTCFLPYMLITTVYFPAVQIIFTGSSCRYWKVELQEE